jgi:hypothetical protein
MSAVAVPSCSAARASVRRAVVGRRLGLEPEPLVLERVRELVGEHHLLEHAVAGAGALHDAQAAVVRVVVAGHALAEQRAAQLAQAGVLVDQAEQLVDLLVGAQALGRILAVEVLEPLAPRLLALHFDGLRQPLEAQVPQRLHAGGDRAQRCRLRQRLGAAVLGREPQPQQGHGEHRHHHQGRPHP